MARCEHAFGLRDIGNLRKLSSYSDQQVVPSQECGEADWLVSKMMSEPGHTLIRVQDKTTHSVVVLVLELFRGVLSVVPRLSPKRLDISRSCLGRAGHQQGIGKLRLDAAAEDRVVSL
jgi:hypothetical protein